MTVNESPGAFFVGNPKLPKPPAMTLDAYAKWVEKEWVAWGKDRRLKAAEVTWKQRVNAPFKA